MSFEEIDLQWFAAEEEGRTEEPSEYKLRKAREEGRVAKSQELNSALVMLVTVIVLIIAAPYFWNLCEETIVFYFTHITETEMFQKRFFFQFLISLAKTVLPMAICGAVAAVLANLIQNRGFIFSLKPIEPQFSKITPKIGQYLKKTLFSFEGGFNVAKSFVKVGVVGLASYLIIRMNLPVILEFINAAKLNAAIGKIAWTAAQILATCAIVFLAIAIPDYLVQKKQFIESMKMTKQEVKQEYKEMEGDPEVKAHLQAAQRELLQRNMPQQVAKSDVVITNPTHFAVALMYDAAVSDAPQVMAKGSDNLALRIRTIAKEHDVPIVENRPLARSLYAETEIGDIIPSDYFSAIATIYSHLEKFNNKK
ncbi:MAG: flagellar biosynthesis protein FlhB [Treponema sp.]|uniref:flagellar biosynthesis protein FlhB n=1 Tax=Treponema sp. TaxID=166 RepID=UPI0025D7B7E2|nr:flagellar biosynthesis protein FlhB [Treponema sp.]MBQ9623445.1 flagellar biosynthesis protein FlhB [Treponema sp.]MBR0495757.1 flagellar biosynthesis protein FlhB [Treponema sp.]